MKKQLSLSFVFFVLSGSLAPLLLADGTVVSEAAGTSKAPIEVGDVQWSRDLDGACKESERSGKPVMVLFQEVPGCSGCQLFGRKVLRHPLIVEASEDLFHPVVVYNNRKGTDWELLQRFNEPAWNYQVIRFLDSHAADIIPREDRVWTLGGVASRMIQALKAAKRPVPKYLEALAQQSTDGKAVAAFAMPCFWSGEVALGGIEGVVATEAGWLERREVVLVTYCTDAVALEDLVKKAMEVKCAMKVYVPKDEQVPIAQEAGAQSVGTFTTEQYKTAEPEDQKRKILRLPIGKLPGLCPMQLTKINALFSADHEAALEWLSPRQKALLEKADDDKAPREVQTPGSAPAKTLELTYKTYRDWDLILPQESFVRVSGDFHFPSLSSSPFIVRLDGSALRIDLDADGAVDAKVEGAEGLVTLRSQTESGDKLRYSIRLKRTNAGWVFAASGAALGILDGQKIRIIDQNNNGRYDDYGEDAMVIGQGRYASFLSRVINVRGKFYSIEVSGDGRTLNYRPDVGATGSARG